MSARKIVLFDRVSADGYFAPPLEHDGQDWVVFEPQLDDDAASRLAERGTLLFGRRTYDQFESFWPAQAGKGEVADPHAPWRKSPAFVAMARWINEATKIVFSRTRAEVTWEGSKLVRDFDPTFVEELKAEPGRDIMIFGSGSIASLLSKHGLIDEYTFVVGPVLLGSGRPLIHDAPRAKLELLECSTFPSGNVRLRYRLKG